MADPSVGGKWKREEETGMSYSSVVERERERKKERGNRDREDRVKGKNL